MQISCLFFGVAVSFMGTKMADVLRSRATSVEFPRL